MRTAAAVSQQWHLEAVFGADSKTTQSISLSKPAACGAGIWDALSKIVSQEGGRKLYRGLTPTMCGILPYAGTVSYILGFLRRQAPWQVLFTDDSLLSKNWAIAALPKACLTASKFQCHYSIRLQFPLAAGIDIAVFGVLRDHMTDAAARQADAAAAAAAAGQPEDAAAAAALDGGMSAQSPLPGEVGCWAVQNTERRNGHGRIC